MTMKRFHLKPLVLASSSPRRRELLASLGIRCRVAPSAFHEPVYIRGESPAIYVKKNAAAKVQTVATEFKRAFIVGADTVVVHRGSVLGKPRTLREAFDTIKRLSGTVHAVYTGLAILDTDDGTMRLGYEKTQVTFRELSEKEIKAYLAAINPLDKAGSYAIQGAGGLIVESIRGCYYNVIGLPLARLDALLLEFGVSLFDYMAVRRGSKGIV